MTQKKWVPSWHKSYHSWMDRPDYKRIRELYPKKWEKCLLRWYELLHLATKTNDGGKICYEENQPISDLDLSIYLRTTIKSVKEEIRILIELKFLEYDDEGYLKICNWGKEQTMSDREVERQKSIERSREWRKSQKSKVTLTNETIDEETLRELIDLEPELDGDIKPCDIRDKIRKKYPGISDEEADDLILDDGESLDMEDLEDE